MPDAGDYLVTGATGNTGSHVVAALRASGRRVRAASRHPGAHGVTFDWADAATFAPALAGVDAIYLVAPVSVADPMPMVGPFLESAAAAGVRRVVQLSSSAVGRGDPGLGEIHELGARLIDEYTALRPSWFMQNFVGDHPLADGIRRSREIISATGTGRLAFIDAADIAAVAVEALTRPQHVGAELLLTGPEAWSYPQAAELISEAIGEPVRHVDVSTDELTARLTSAGYPAEFAAALAALDGRIRSGEQDFVTATVSEITGRPPTGLREFLTRECQRVAL
ncbi:NAD(P)H-binding protein [Mycolicibacterium vaccae]|uniref:NmrA family NAD(P)-binding protein n=1 Tax=Mycolicibacterium vaccae TaxID=1810 RepID=UPI003CFD909C